MELPWIMRIGPLVTAVVATEPRTVEKCICTPIISRASGTTRDVPPPVLSSVREQGIIPLAESDLFLMRDTYCQNIMCADIDFRSLSKPGYKNRKNYFIKINYCRKLRRTSR